MRRAESFHQLVAGIDPARLEERILATTPDQVERVLRQPRLRPADVLPLLSPAADERLEELVQRAAATTEQRFGRTMQLYVPLYLSSECTNRCLYCGFAHDVVAERCSLSLDEAVANARVLHEQGFRQILLVTGEAPSRYGVDDLEEVVRAIGPLFDSISIEVFPMSLEDYARLARAGVDGLVLYQETYDREVYARVHPAGRKSDYRWRLEGPDRGGRAGFRSLGLGVLLGLAPWRADAAVLVQHAAWLQRRHWRSRIAVSFPRMVHSERGFQATHSVADRELVQAMAALRIVLPDAELVLSTREPAELRDGLMGSFVTRMSAGSRTSPGGYLEEGLGEQFEAQDLRTPAEIAALLRERGIDPVWKDLDKGFRV
jgi:2-iminoacetate synthase